MPDVPAFIPADWYWVVNGSTARVYSSKVGDYVDISDPAYTAWLAAGGVPSRSVSEAELGEVLAAYSLRPAATNVLDGYLDTQSRQLTSQIVAKVLLWCVNEIRKLKGQPSLQADGFRTFVKGLL